MSEPFLGQITYFAGTFAPKGYAFCDGQLLSIQQNSALFSILGVTYGGNGVQTFALPDLRGRYALHVGGSTGPGQPSYVLGQQAGAVSTTLTIPNLPAHIHTAQGVLNATTTKAVDAIPNAGYQLSRPIDGDGDPNAVPYIYGPVTGTQVALGGLSVTTLPTGSNIPASTQSPYQGLNAIIALQGIFPSRN